MPTTKRVPDTLRLPPNRRPVPTRTRLRTRSVPIVAHIAIMLTLPVAVYVGARASGWWVTTGRTVPSTALGAPDAAEPAAGNGSGNGQGEKNITGANPDEVRGSMTVQDVLDAFPQVSAMEIFDLFGVPADTPTSTQLKTLAQEGNGYEISDLREWLKTKQ